MKKRIIFIFGVAFPCLLLTVPVSAQRKERISRSEVTMREGETIKLRVLNKKGKVKWSSTNKKIVSVDRKGKVSAKKKGTAIVVAKVKKKKFTYKVTVKSQKEDYEADSLAVRNGIFTKDIYNRIQKIHWETVSKTVTGQKGIYKIYSILSSMTVEQLPENTEKLVGGITLFFTMKDGSKLGFTVGGNVLFMDNKMYAVPDNVGEQLQIALQEYSK